MDPTKLKFGHTYADYMMTCDWHQDKGWLTPKIEPIAELKIHPGAKVIFNFYLNFIIEADSRTWELGIRTFQSYQRMAPLFQLISTDYCSPLFSHQIILSVLKRLGKSA